MPADPAARRFDLENANRWNAVAAGTEEREMAIADAECRESSGFREAHYQAEWSGQEGLLESHKTELLDAWKLNRAALASAQSVIDRIGR